MKASFNYTGRIRLDNSCFSINILEQKESASELEASLIKDMITGVPAGAVALIEAYNRSKVMLFELGEWDRTKNTRFKLTEFDPDEPLLFRIKIVDRSNKSHPIKAWRDRIRPVVYDSTGQKKKSVLPVKPVDLGHIAWKIDWSDPTRPILLVNSRINDARDVTSIVKNDHDFAALVFPQVIREILTHLLLEDSDIDEENEWIIFANNLVGRECARREDNEEADKDLVEAWVEDVAQAYGLEAKLIQRYINYKKV